MSRNSPLQVTPASAASMLKHHATRRNLHVVHQRHRGGLTAWELGEAPHSGVCKAVGWWIQVVCLWGRPVGHGVLVWAADSQGTQPRKTSARNLCVSTRASKEERARTRERECERVVWSSRASARSVSIWLMKVEKSTSAFSTHYSPQCTAGAAWRGSPVGGVCRENRRTASFT